MTYLLRGRSCADGQAVVYYGWQTGETRLYTLEVDMEAAKNSAAKVFPGKAKAPEPSIVPPAHNSMVTIEGTPDGLVA